MQNIRHIIESLLFVSDEPLSVSKIKAVLETVDTKEIKTALHALADQYEARGGGFGLSEVAGGWQMRSRPEHHQWIKRLLQPSPHRLSKAALETLAIVAYNQPIIRADIEHIRGVDCGGILRQLMERKLVRVLGRKEIPGRPLIYATSKLFLELFDLRDLKDLPTPKEMEEMGVAAEHKPNQQVDAPSGDLLGTTADLALLADEPSSSSTISDLESPPPVEQAESYHVGANHFTLSATPNHINQNTAAGIATAIHKVPWGKPIISATPPTFSVKRHAVPGGTSNITEPSRVNNSDDANIEDHDELTAQSSTRKSKNP